MSGTYNYNFVHIQDPEKVKLYTLAVRCEELIGDIPKFKTAFQEFRQYTKRHSLESESKFSQDEIGKAVSNFIEVASEKAKDAVAGIGNEMALMANKVCHTVQEKIFYVFDMVAQFANKVNKNSPIKKLVETMSNFIEISQEQPKSIINKAQEAIGGFSHKILKERDRKEQERKHEAKIHNQSAF